jgi:hypothetical protein
MNVGVAIALRTMCNVIEEYEAGVSFDKRLSDARVIRESAAVVANAAEEDIMDALEHVGTKSEAATPDR